MKTRGSLRYGSSFPDSTVCMWPLAKLTISGDALEVTLPWRKFRLPRQSVTRLIKHTGAIAIGVQIEHTVLQEPNLMVFWTYHFGDIKNQLQAHGYSFTARR